MKRVLCLAFAVLFVVALFAGCGGNTANNGGSTNTPQQSSTPQSTKAPDSGSTTGGNEGGEEQLYAAGKFKADANGLALEKYDYPLPLTTSDEVLTVWTTCYSSEYLPEEGYDAVEFAMEVANRTGVHTETTCVPNAQRQENFAVLSASDELMDIMMGASACYSGPFVNAVEEEEFFVNLYDYRQYMPNFIYETTKDPDDIDTIHKVFTRNDMITQFYELRKERELSSGAFARGDWLYEMGKTNKDIVTFDDYHEMFTYFKAFKCDTPFTVLNTLELAGAYEFVGFDTYCCASISTTHVVDGKVRIAASGENDLKLMTMLNQWFSEGLIDPNWSSYANIPDIGDKLTTSKMGYIAGTRATTMKSNDSAIPEDAPVGWVAMTKPLQYEGQTLHMGYQTDRAYWGSGAIATRCENIPLAVTWLDWRYGEEGSFLYGYGVQGLSWDYNDEGEIEITDFICSHPGGWTMIMLIYALNSITEPGLYINYAYNAPGNEVALEYLQTWESAPHDNLYVYPSGITYTPEQNEVIASKGSDVSTYIQENYVAFMDGSKSLSEWDSYVAELHNIGLEDLLAVYQEAYESYIAA